MTVTMIAPPTVVAGPDRTPLPGGLFSVLTFRPNGADRWETGVTWEADDPHAASGIGPYNAGNPAATVGLPKTVNGSVPIGSAQPFSVYGHFSASPTAYPPADAQDRARRHLENHEEYWVEKALWTGILGNKPSLRDATLLSATAMTPRTGLGFLEDWIGSEYGGLGVIHVSRYAATILASVEQLVQPVRNGRFFTALGTPVVAGSGYDGSGPAGSPALGDNETYVYVTPALMGYRSEIFEPTDRPGDLLARGTNDMLAVAERSYLIGYDPVGAAAVLLGTA